MAGTFDFAEPSRRTGAAFILAMMWAGSWPAIAQFEPLRETWVRPSASLPPRYRCPNGSDTVLQVGSADQSAGEGITPKGQRGGGRGHDAEVDRLAVWECAEKANAAIWQMAAEDRKAMFGDAAPRVTLDAVEIGEASAGSIHFTGTEAGLGVASDNGLANLEHGVVLTGTGTIVSARKPGMRGNVRKQN